MEATNSMPTDAGIKAFAAAGRTVRSTTAVQLSEGGSLGAALKSVTGGKVELTRVDIVLADSTVGPEVLMQPYAGNTPLPGELYASVPGALYAPAAYDDSGFLGFGWASPNDELKKYLKSNKFEAHMLSEELKHGLTKIKLGWTLQIFAAAADRSVVVGHIGGFSGMGQEPALAAIDALAPAIAQSRAEGPSATLHPLRFRQLAELAFAGELDAALGGQAVAAAAPKAALPPTEARAAIEATLSGHVGKRVLVGTINDEKKLANIAKKIAVDVNPTEICGFIDTGLRASGKAGAAFTPTAVYFNELGDRCSFEYSEIASFRLDGSEVSVVGTNGASVKIASNSEASIIMDALVAATGRPG